MAQRRSPAQVRAQLRQAQQRQQQAVRKYNEAVRKYNSERRQAIVRANRAINRYNTEVRKFNAARRTERARLQRELQRMSSQTPVVTRRMTTHVSVQTVVSRFDALEQSADAGAVDGAWLDLSERETANSVATFNALFDTEEAADSGSVEDLQVSGIDAEVDAVGADLTLRWRGALFALNPRNPDASRHFTTSAREMLGHMLELVAPDDVVLAADPDCPKTPQGDVSRRARIYYCLARQGYDIEVLADFVEADVDNVVQLFNDFNSGTHGEAGRFPLVQLVALKRRVEDAVRFVHAVAFGIAA